MRILRVLLNNSISKFLINGLCVISPVVFTSSEYETDKENKNLKAKVEALEVKHELLQSLYINCLAEKGKYEQAHYDSLIVQNSLRGEIKSLHANWQYSELRARHMERELTAYKNKFGNIEDWPKTIYIYTNGRFKAIGDSLHYEIYNRGGDTSIYKMNEELSIFKNRLIIKEGKK